jgi:hypothetical protein
LSATIRRKLYACVAALNQFIQAHGRTEMVVCSRIRDYEALSERLRLRSAIYVQPLTPQQIDRYLEQAGEQLTSLKTLLNHNAEIKTFASSPLILSIMSLAYKGHALEEFPQSITADTFRQRLFDAYIERMLTRRQATQQYSQEQTKRWLSWMAQRLTQASQTVFLIERMQPSWLQTRLQRTRYRLESALISGLISGLIAGLGDTLIVGLIIGLIIGLISVLGAFLVFVQLSGGKISGLTSWLIIGLIIVLISPLIGGLIAALIGGFRGPEIQKKLEPNQGIWKSARNALTVGLMAGLMVGSIGWLMTGPIGWLMVGSIGWLMTGPIGGLTAGLIGGLIYGGAACLRHFSLRLMLYRMGYIPWNYARFLDYAAERLFLQKVGGGYIFVHRMLLEHFAQMELEQERP